MVRPTARAKTNVVYFLQTHARPAQVARLVRVTDAMVLISHDVAGPALNVAGLRALGSVHVFPERGGYGDFSHVGRYLAAVDWLDANGIDYDWLENLTGQDYPLRPVAEIEDALAMADCDGFLQYSPVFPERVPAGADRGTPGYTLVRAVDAATRYDYRHWRLGKPTPAKQHWMRPLMVLNFVQPWVRVFNSTPRWASAGARCSVPGSTATAGRSSARCARSAPGTPGPTRRSSTSSVAPPPRKRCSCTRSRSTPAGSASARITSATSTGPGAPTPTREPSGPGTFPRCWPAARTGRASSTRGRTPGCSTCSTSESGPGHWP